LAKVNQTGFARIRCGSRSRKQGNSARLRHLPAFTPGTLLAAEAQNRDAIFSGGGTLFRRAILRSISD
jgi:hypothetical protein